MDTSDSSETSETVESQPTRRRTTEREACWQAHSDEEAQWMNLLCAHTLLGERGYDLRCCFDHVHAVATGQEWHICRVDELATMHPAQFLACLEEAMRFRW